MEENFNIHLGKKLRMRRLSLGLTQTKVATSHKRYISANTKIRKRY
mgnify:CR=1 FL=1